MPRYNLFYHENLILKSKIGLRSMGDETILKRPYENILIISLGSFPSGDVKEITFIKSLQSIGKNNISIFD